MSETNSILDRNQMKYINNVKYSAKALKQSANWVTDSEKVLVDGNWVLAD